MFSGKILFAKTWPYALSDEEIKEQDRKYIMEQETNKPNEVVKDLQWFLDKEALDISFNRCNWKDFNKERSAFIEMHNGNGEIFHHEHYQLKNMELNAVHSWYKHQLEDKDKELQTEIKINEQLRLDCLKVQDDYSDLEKHSNGIAIELLQAKNTINKLTQENEALKQK